jgi:hypothetical protein
LALSPGLSSNIVDDSSQQSAARAVEDAPEWFFARGGTHHGPVPLHELQRMVTSGEIESNGLVWKRGMAAWVPAHQVPELRFPGGSTMPSLRDSNYPAQPILTTSTAFQPPRTSGLAIASLVLGLVWLCGLGSLLALIFASVALSQISRSRGRLEGKGLAIAGLILGILGLSLFALPFFASFLAGILNRLQRD